MLYKYRKLPKLGEKSEGREFSSEDYSLDDYVTTIKDILGGLLANDYYISVQEEELGKTLKDLVAYTDVAKGKTEIVAAELKDLKNKLDNKEEQEGFLRNKSDLAYYYLDLRRIRETLRYWRARLRR